MEVLGVSFAFQLHGVELGILQGILQRDFASLLKPPLSLEFANNLEMFLLAVGLAEVCFDKQ